MAWIPTKYENRSKDWPDIHFVSGSLCVFKVKELGDFLEVHRYASKEFSGNNSADQFCTY